MQIPLLSGIRADSVGEFRTSYPKNLIPVPTDTGLSKGYLRPIDGVVQNGVGPGIGRGGVNWNGVLYRVMGTKLCSIGSDGTVAILGDVGGTSPVTFSPSFDRLAIASNNGLFYWNGSTLTQVVDPDLDIVLDVKFVGGYFVTTDGTYIITTDINDPTSVNPLHYGSSEADPDPIVGIDELRNEVYAFNRYTVETFQNIGGTGFPFQVIEGAQVPKGAIGTHAFVGGFRNTFAFVGSGRNEAPAVYLLVPGDTQKLSTREIDQILLGYSEAVLSQIVVETKTDKNHEMLFIHLPDRCLVYDDNASQASQQLVWHTRATSLTGHSQYRAKNLVWVYDKWFCEDPATSAIGYLDDTVATHFTTPVGFEFSVPFIYNGGNGAIVHELELVALPGRVVLGANPTVWTSYSLDGQLWSQERGVSAGKQGERQKRIAWRSQGIVKNYRGQKFRWTSDAHMSVARLEAQLEALTTRPTTGG